MLIVLDIDDTLYLERDYVLSGFRAVGEWLHANGYSIDFENRAWKLFEQGVRGTIFDRALDEKRDPRLIKQMVAVYRSHQPTIDLLPDAKDFLDRCDSHALGVISDGPVEAQERKVSALGLGRMIPSIVLTDRWGLEYRKPHARAFRELMAERKPEECIYIADNPEKDFIAPATLAWQPSIRVRRAGSLHAETATPPGCREVATLAEVTF